MSAYTPTSSRQRAALAALSFSVSLSLIGSVLLLFSDGQMPWAEVQAKAPKQAPGCADGGPPTPACVPRVAQVEAPARQVAAAL